MITKAMDFGSLQSRPTSSKVWSQGFAGERGGGGLK